MKLTMQLVRRPLTLALAAACILSSQAVFATPFLHIPVYAFAKPSIVKLNLLNRTSTSLEVKVGDDIMTIGAGKTISVKVPVGTRILTNTATSTHPAGDLIVEVDRSLDGVTVGIG